MSEQPSTGYSERTKDTHIHKIESSAYILLILKIDYDTILSST